MLRESLLEPVGAASAARQLEAARAYPWLARDDEDRASPGRSPGPRPSATTSANDSVPPTRSTRARASIQSPGLRRAQEVDGQRDGRAVLVVVGVGARSRGRARSRRRSRAARPGSCRGGWCGAPRRAARTRARRSSSRTWIGPMCSRNGPWGSNVGEAVGDVHAAAHPTLSRPCPSASATRPPPSSSARASSSSSACSPSSAASTASSSPTTTSRGATRAATRRSRWRG